MTSTRLDIHIRTFDCVYDFHLDLLQPPRRFYRHSPKIPITQLTMAWQPQSDQLNQLAQCLRDSLSGHDVAAQKNAEQVC